MGRLENVASENEFENRERNIGTKNMDRATCDGKHLGGKTVIAAQTTQLQMENNGKSTSGWGMVEFIHHYKVKYLSLFQVCIRSLRFSLIPV